MRYHVCWIALIALSACESSPLTGPVDAAPQVAAVTAAVAPGLVICRRGSGAAPGPLYVVDDVIVNEIAALKAMTARGARVTVAKGPEAIALYGSRASVSVVLVTTPRDVR